MFKLELFGQKLELSERHINMVSVFVILASSMFLFLGKGVGYSVSIAFFLVSLIFETGGRFFFILALGFLISTAVFTSIKKIDIAETSAIAVYYLLLSGTLLELIGSKLHFIYTNLDHYIRSKYKHYV